ncbi:MAG: protein kinase [Desulfuromonadales bacterium]|nr:protein kinase [Desulfuromonadales bacterium]
MLESGHSIADYQIVKPLAENQLYETYQVIGPQADEVKLLLIAPEKLSAKKARQVFFEQAEKLAGQSFPGLCSLIQVETDAEHHFCVYPFPVGVPLAGKLADGFTVRQSLELLRQLAAALIPAHAAGLWHGNISPTTLYISGASVTLDDFALSSLVKLDFYSGVDPRYSSPELVRGEPLTCASDLYSLGIVLYRLLTGKVPFDQDDPFATAMLHVHGQVSPLPEHMTLLQPVIDGLLTPLPAKRLSSEELFQQIDQLLVLPEIDQLSSCVKPVEECPEAESIVPETPSRMETLMSHDDMASRIEKRLQDRAETLNSSGELTTDAKRAGSARLTSIGQQHYRNAQTMKQSHYRQNAPVGRFALLIALGVILGAVLYFVFFGRQSPQKQLTNDLPVQLVAGLSLGSQQFSTGDISGAEKTFLALIENYSFYPQPYNNLAAVYAFQGNLENSRTFLEKALATDDAYVTVYRNLGTVYSEMARDSYGRALQLEGDRQNVALRMFMDDEMQQIVSAAQRPPAVKLEQPETPVVAASENVSAFKEPETLQRGEAQPAAEPVVAIDPGAEKTISKEDAAAELVLEVVLEPQPESAGDFLLRWAAAWSAQDVESYLSFYADEFTPAADGSREDWAAQRRRRLVRPKKIEVSLEDFSLVRQADGLLQIEVTQSYRSDRYADRTRKLFDLQLAENNWGIIRERSLGRVR